MHKTDLAIIGAGPVGLFTVFQAGMLGIKTAVIDTLEFVGGQCTALYPEKPIYDIPGYPEILAGDLIKKLEEQASPFDPKYFLNQQVIKVEQQQDKSWNITTSEENIINAKCIVLAAGCGAFGPNRPPIENLEEFEGKSVFYMVGKKEDFRDKTVVIAGGGDSAVDWAISLSDIAKKVYVIHRRDKFRAAPESVNKMKKIAESGKIELVIPYQLKSISGTDGQLESIEVATLDGQSKNIKADVLLPFFGLAMELGPIAEWGLNIEKNHIDINPATQETNQPRIYAIGDVAAYPGKLKLILTGFAEAARACHSAYAHIFPDQALHFEYSTTKGLPKAS